MLGLAIMRKQMHVMVEGSTCPSSNLPDAEVMPPMYHHTGLRGPSAKHAACRVRDMLAMRACRSSIMIGKALNRTQLKSVLVHLSHLDSPWNCPHGRPTMRHLHTLQQQ